MHTLPPLPEGIRPLLNAESDRLEREYPDLPDSPLRCGTCSGKETFRWWDRYSNPPRLTVVVDYQCPCADQWVMSRRFLYHGIGTVYQRLGWADLVAVEPQAKEQVADYLCDFERHKRAGIGLVLHGGLGTGKSLLGAMIAKQVLALGHDAYFATFAEMLKHLTSGWDSVEDREWYAKRIRNAGLLVLDDIGREHKQRRHIAGEGLVDNPMALSESSADDLLRHRVAHAKPTIITTNHDLETLEAHYGSNVMSLFDECSITYHFTGENFRAKAKVRTVDESRQGLVRPVVVG